MKTKEKYIEQNTERKKKRIVNNCAFTVLHPKPYKVFCMSISDKVCQNRTQKEKQNNRNQDRNVEEKKCTSRKYILCLPFSDVLCFSAGRSMAAGRTAGSERPFELNA